MKPFKPPVPPSLDKAADAARRLAEKSKAKLGGLKPPWTPPSPGEKAAAIAIVEKYLARAAKSPAAGKKEFGWVKQCLIERVADGEDVDVLRDELAERAAREVAKRGHLLDLGKRLATTLGQGNRLARIRSEVIQPASAGRMDSRAAWAKADEISGIGILRTVFGYDPGVTVCIGAAAEGGFGAGFEASTTLGGMLHKTACVVNSLAGAVGAYAEVSVSGQIAFNEGTPWELGGFAGVVGGGFGAGVSGGVGVSFTPVSFEPSPHVRPDQWITWKYDGLSVDVGAGAGIEISLGIEYSTAWVLGGQPPE